MSQTTEQHEADGLTFGEDADGRMVPISEARSGLSCGLICPECRRRLVAKKGHVIRHHFAHEADGACAGAVESMLHKLAKQIIADAQGVQLPAAVAVFGPFTEQIAPARWLVFDRVDTELWMQGVRPDIVGYRDNRSIAIEVFVTHVCGPEKVALLSERRQAAIEINLSAFRRTSDFAEIREAVLRSAPRQWLFNAKLAETVDRLRAEDARRRQAAAEEAARQLAAIERQREQEARQRGREMFSRLRLALRRSEAGRSLVWLTYLETKLPCGNSVKDVILRGDENSRALLDATNRWADWFIHQGRNFAALASFAATDESLERAGLLSLKDRKDRILEARHAERRKEVEEMRKWLELEEAKKAKADAEQRAAAAQANMVLVRELRAHAHIMLGLEDGERWMRDAALPDGYPKPNALNDHIISAERYWRSLRARISEAGAKDEASKKARAQLLRMATRHFRSEDRARLWMNSTSPTLGRRRPYDVCIEPAGLIHCQKALR